MSCDTRASLAGGRLHLDQSSFLLSDLAGLVIGSSSLDLVGSFLGGAFSRGFFLDSLLRLIKGLLLCEVRLKLSDVFGQVLVDRVQGALLLGEKVSLASEEAEQAVEVVVDTLGLLNARHE
jgi:hypothetical protein